MNLQELSLEDLAALNKKLAANEANSKAQRDAIAVEVHKRLHLQQAVDHLAKLTPEQKAALAAELEKRKV